MGAIVVSRPHAGKFDRLELINGIDPEPLEDGIVTCPLLPPVLCAHADAPEAAKNAAAATTPT